MEDQLHYKKKISHDGKLFYCLNKHVWFIQKIKNLMLKYNLIFILLGAALSTSIRNAFLFNRNVDEAWNVSEGKLENGKFEFEIECQSDFEICTKIYDVIVEIGYYLSSAIDFHVPLNVGVVIFSFEKGILAKTNISDFYYVKEFSDIRYPQALARQLWKKSGEKDQKKNPHDFIIALNLKYLSERCKETVFDVVLHEFFHGLGMVSSFRRFTYKDLILPSLSKLNPLKISDLYIYDRFLRDDESFLYQKLDKIKNLAKKTGGVLDETTENEIIRLFDRKSLKYWVERIDSEIPVDKNVNFENLGALSHLSQTLDHNPHYFLMTPKNSKLKTKVRNCSIHSGIFLIIEQLGYDILPPCAKELNRFVKKNNRNNILEKLLGYLSFYK